MPSQKRDTNKLQIVLRVGENDPPVFIHVHSTRFVIHLWAGIMSIKIINTFHHLQNIICTFSSFPQHFLQRFHLLYIPYFSTRGQSCLCHLSCIHSWRYEWFTPPWPAIVTWILWYQRLGSREACHARTVSVGEKNVTPHF